MLRNGFARGLHAKTCLGTKHDIPSSNGASLFTYYRAKCLFRNVHRNIHHPSRKVPLDACTFTSTSYRGGKNVWFTHIGNNRWPSYARSFHQNKLPDANKQVLSQACYTTFSVDTTGVHLCAPSISIRTYRDGIMVKLIYFRTTCQKKHGKCSINYSNWSWSTTIEFKTWHRRIL